MASARSEGKLSKKSSFSAVCRASVSMSERVSVVVPFSLRYAPIIRNASPSSASLRCVLSISVTIMEAANLAIPFRVTNSSLVIFSFAFISVVFLV